MYLNDIINKLSISSKEAIASGNTELDTFNQYLHVQRSIEKDLIAELERAAGSSENQLIILAGNVGDGKSHLISYLREQRPELMCQFYIHNDATESFDYSTDALTTLKQNIFDKLQNEQNQKIILAINLGIIYNFINKFNETAIEIEFANFIQKSEVFSGYTKHAEKQNSMFSIVSFSDYQLFSIESGSAKSEFLVELFTKIARESTENPFHMAYLQSKQQGIDLQLIKNYDFFRQEIVLRNIIDLIIQATVKFKLVISMRQIYQFIYECLSVTNYENQDESSFVENFFNKDTQNQLLLSIRTFDPLKESNQAQDLSIIEQLQNGRTYKDIKHNEWKNFLLSSDVRNKQIENYVQYLYGYYGPEKAKSDLKQLYIDVKEVLLSWDGKSTQGTMYLDKSESVCRISQMIDPKPKLITKNINEELLQYFSLTLMLNFMVDNEIVSLNLDYKLYDLVMKLKSGYRPNKVDREKAIHLTDCIDKILQIATKNQTQLFFTLEEQQKTFALEVDDFGDFTFREV